MRKLTIFTLLLWTIFSFAQDSKALYLKGNLLLAPVGILNAGLEYQISPKYTLQADVTISPWKSFAGYNAQVYMGTLEGRYYFNEAFKKWYIGVNAGSGVFDLTKFNYAGTNKYQRGFNFMFGAVAGYQFQWKENWNIDVFVGGGSIQSFYHGYENIPPSIFRYDGATGWNKSGELLPFRGGLMISYKLK